MNETPPPPGPPAAAPASERRPRLRAQMWVWLTVALVVIAGAVAYRDLARNQTRLREQIIRIEAESTPAVTQARQAVQDAQRELAELKQTVDALQSERAALDQLVGDTLRMRDEAALIDIERLITLASAELQISGHVPTALAALQSADQRLMQVERPQYLGLRRALGRDIDRLRAVPQVDFTGLALRLDQLLQAIDGWPLLADPKPARALPAKKEKTEPRPAPAPPSGAWERIRAWIALEFGELVRIREVETPEALLLSSSQQQLVRERLKLRLLSARQALLARNDRLFRSDLEQAQATINRYFDARAAGPSQALTQLKQIAQTTLAVDVPALNESLAALRAVRTAPPLKRP